ncbi:MAG: TrkH family potassium uptake protein [Opitutales bacterium]
MNYRLLCKLLAMVLFTVDLAFAASLGAGFIRGDASGWNAVTVGWVASIGLASSLALALFLYGRGAPNRLFRKEALAVIGIGWLLATLVGALPYAFLLPVEISGGWFNHMADALFESASGLTTTGASVFTNLETFPDSLLFWRALSQWIGGLGVVVFFVAILSFLGAGAKILYSNEASASSADIDSARIQKGVLRIFWFYFAISLLCCLAYYLLGMHIFDALCHTFTTISTGGFSTYSASFAAFDSAAIEWTAILFMTLGGTSFLYMICALRGNRQQMRSNSEVPAYLIFLVTGVAAMTLVLLTEGREDTLPHTIRRAAFQVVSIMTSTGYATENYNLWPGGAHVILLIVMVIGGCSGSTAGGIKVVRVVVGLRVAFRNIELHFRPHVVRPIRANGRVLDRGDQQDVAVYFLICALMTFFTMGLLTLIQPTLAFEDLLSSIFACLFNIGPGLGKVGPSETYAFYDPISKTFLSLLMVMGRLEFYAILVLFSPSLWKRFS